GRCSTTSEATPSATRRPAWARRCRTWTKPCARTRSTWWRWPCATSCWRCPCPRRRRARRCALIRVTGAPGRSWRARWLAPPRPREGNRRFTSNVRSLDALLTHTRRAELATAPQYPIAIVLGCSDARVPAEVVFDQGLGDLFVIRVAGNIVAPSQVGSVEFAA